MTNEEFMNSLNEEVKKKLTECKTQEGVQKVLVEAGVEPIDDEVLDAATGGTAYLLPVDVFDIFR